MHRIKNKYRNRNLEDSMRIPLNISNNPKKVADISLMECQCFAFSIFHLKNSNCLRFLCYFVEKLFLGSAIQPTPIVPRTLPLV